MNDIDNIVIDSKTEEMATRYPRIADFGLMTAAKINEEVVIVTNHPACDKGGYAPCLECDSCDEMAAMERELSDGESINF